MDSTVKGSPGIPVKIVPADSISESRRCGLGSDGFYLVPRLGSSGYAQFASGFAVGFSPGGRIADLDCYIGPADAGIGSLRLDLPEQIFDITLLAPLLLDGDTLDFGAGRAFVDRARQVWWCHVQPSDTAVRVGQNILALMSSDRNLVGIAIELARV